MYEKYQDRMYRKSRGEQVSEEEEEEEDEEGEPKSPPEKPVFNEAEALKKFDEKDENIVLVIPNEVVDDVDDDWPMTAQEEQDYINQLLDAKTAV